MKYWLVKSDPDSYGWDDMKRDKKTDWDGVRNYQARNNLKEMSKGDVVLFYMSVSDKLIMGTTKVTKQYYQDPTTDDNRWVAVELEFEKDFKKPVSLVDIKSKKELKDIALVKQSRLSVMPISKKEFEIIVEMAR